jgi:hypothetical protein
VRDIIAERARNREGATPQPSSIDRQWLSEHLSRKSLDAWLRDEKAAQQFDASTILRALGPDASTLAVEASKARRRLTAVTVVTSAEQRSGSGVLCLDVVALGGVEATVRWIQASGAIRRDRTATILIAAVGRAGEDMSALAPLVDGIVARPNQGSAEAWENSVAPLRQAHRNPEYREALPPEETHGGVSAEEFEERIAQAALSDLDPRKRD